MGAPIRAPWKNRPGWSEFGAARPGLAGNKHRGYDWYCLEGTAIYGYANGGEVTASGTGAGANSFGNNCQVTYPGGVRIQYAHMRDKPPARGTKINEGTIIGYVGHTGSAATVEWGGLRHLHEEVLVNGTLRDPRAFHGVTGAASGGGTSPIDNASPQSGDENMRHLRVTDGTIFFCTAGGITPVENPDHLAVLQRFVSQAPQNFDTFNGVQRDWIGMYISRAQTGDQARYTALLTAIKDADDSPEIAAAVATLQASLDKVETPEPYKFTEEDLATIGESVQSSVALTSEQLDQIVSAAQTGAHAGVEALSFVVTASPTS